MSQIYVPIPDFTPGLPKVDREGDLFKWLSDNCEWREREWSATHPIYEAYAAWEKSKQGMPVAARSVEQSLVSLGFIVQGARVLGVFLREKDATMPVAAPQSDEVARVGSPSSALIEANVGPLPPQPKVIDKDDSDLEAYRKMQFNEQLLKK